MGTPRQYGISLGCLLYHPWAQPGYIPYRLSVHSSYTYRDVIAVMYMYLYCIEKSVNISITRINKG